jgi:hypothetical protein
MINLKNLFAKYFKIFDFIIFCNFNKHQNKLLKTNMKIEKFPGGVVYVVEDYDINQEIIYKIGKTDDMNKRIKIYNTHSIHNKHVAYYVDIKCPLQLETCLKSMLYKYRIKNRKDFFNCSLIKIKKQLIYVLKILNVLNT